MIYSLTHLHSDPKFKFRHREGGEVARRVPDVTYFNALCSARRPHTNNRTQRRLISVKKLQKKLVGGACACRMPRGTENVTAGWFWGEGDLCRFQTHRFFYFFPISLQFVSSFLAASENPWGTSFFWTNTPPQPERAF